MHLSLQQCVILLQPDGPHWDIGPQRDADRIAQYFVNNRYVRKLSLLWLTTQYNNSVRSMSLFNWSAIKGPMCKI